MKRTFGIFFSLIGGTLLATNGANFIGLSPSSIGMGGTGIAHRNGSVDVIFKNPALLAQTEAPAGSFSFEADATLFWNKATSSQSSQGATDKISQAKALFLPQIGAAYQLNENWGVGLGIFPYGGARSDYTGEAELLELKVDSKFVKVMPALSVQVQNFSFGVSPVLGLSELALSYRNINSTPLDPSDDSLESHVPHGDVAFGVQVGVVGRVENFQAGLVYISPMEFTYPATADIDYFGSGTHGALDEVKVQQPAEYGLGLSYDFTPEFSVTFDYRLIAWSKANMYRQLGWKNQSVFALGTQYRCDKWVFRAGFNYAKSAVENATGETGATLVDLQGHDVFSDNISLLNVIGLAPITQSHITFGVGHKLTDSLQIDTSVVYAPKVTVSRAGTNILTLPYNYTTTNHQWMVTAGLRYGL